MNRVAGFEKVSFEEFYNAVKEQWYGCSLSENKIMEIYGNLHLPTRATMGSAGYDFASPFTFDLEPGGSIKIPTGIRARIDNGWCLFCMPRSGLGFKYRLQLDNTIGLIDSDYYNSDNEGHIFAKITNDSKESKVISIFTGDRFMQGVFLPYGIAYTDNTTVQRNGGMGSTN